MGFTKNWCVAKVLKTQGSKEILREMDKGSLRSLEKFFFGEEMVRWRWGRIVLMVEEKMREEETKKRKKEKRET